MIERLGLYFLCIATVVSVFAIIFILGYMLAEGAKWLIKNLKN